MYKPNKKHLQPALISAISELPEKQLKILKGSWSESFYREFFCKLNEDIFAVLYANEPSRPNVPVNVLVGLEIIKAGFGWSDEELFENFCFNLQVRHALGYDRLGDGDFAIRTLYYFRERLSKHYLETDINLLKEAFEQVTDIQIEELQVRTGMQRMDSTQIASNIVNASRLQLLVEAIQRMYRVMSKADQECLAEVYMPYIQGTAGQYTYRVKGKQGIQEHLQQAGIAINHMLSELKDGYANEIAYQVLERIFTDNFKLVEEEVRPKEDEEIESGSLQSVDDLEASYRTKGNTHYKGYVVNLSETCDTENDVQLVTDIQVAPNNVDDTQLLEESLPNLVERTDLNTLFTDGGYGSPDTDKVMKGKVQQIQTAIRGRKPSEDKLHLSDFEIEHTEEDIPTRIICPNQQTVEVHSTKQGKGFVAHFDRGICQNCSYSEKCPSEPGKRDPDWHLRFNQKKMYVSQRRRLSQQYLEEGKNPRAAVESTVRQIKHPFPASKLPVRGQFRVACMMVGSAIMTNIRRIQQYRSEKQQKNQELETSNDDSSISFVHFFLFFLKPDMFALPKIEYFNC